MREFFRQVHRRWWEHRGSVLTLRLKQALVWLLALGAIAAAAPYGAAAFTITLLVAVVFLGAFVPYAVSEQVELQEQVEALCEAGDFAEALPLAERILAIAQQQFDGWEERFGDTHTNMIVGWELAEGLDLVGVIQWKLEHLGEAETCFRRAVELLADAKTDDHGHRGTCSRAGTHPARGDALARLAHFYAATGRPDEAAATFDKLVDARRAVVSGIERDADAGHVALIGALMSLAQVLDGAERVEESEAVYLRAITLAEGTASVSEQDRWICAAALFDLGDMYKRRDRRDDAIARLEQSRTIASAGEGGDETTAFIARIEAMLAELRGAARSPES